MKTLINSLLALAFLFVADAKAQMSDEDIEALYVDLVLELDKAISSKGYEKTWKEQQFIWEEKVNECEGISCLCGKLSDLQTQLRNDRAFASNWPSKKNKWNKVCKTLKRWDTFGQHLIDFESYLNSSVYSKEWDNRKNGWISDVHSANAEFIKAEKIKAPDVIINEEEFNSVYNKIFKTSISGLDPFKVGSPSKNDINGEEVTHWGTAVKLPAAQSAIIEYRKKYEVLNYTASWHAGTSKENAKKVLANIVKLVAAQMPDTYSNTEKYSREFVDYKEFLFEYNSDKFAAVQKRPSIVLGIKKDGGKYSVVLRLSEPYFKNQY